MNSQNRLTTPSVLVFDVNETLIDIESIAPLFGELFGDERVLREWFGQLVMYSMTATLAESYVDFFTLGQGVLHMLADIYRVDVTDDDVHRLQAGMRTMPAHPRRRRRTHSLARQWLSSCYADEFTAQGWSTDTARERRARGLFRAAVQRRILPRVQAVAIGLPVCVSTAGRGARELHDGGRPCVGYPRRPKRRLQQRPHHTAGQSTAAS